MNTENESPFPRFGKVEHHKVEDKIGIIGSGNLGTRAALEIENQKLRDKLEFRDLQIQLLREYLASHNKPEEALSFYDRAINGVYAEVLDKVNELFQGK